MLGMVNKKEYENLKNEKVTLEVEYSNLQSRLEKATENYKKTVQHKDEKIKELEGLLHSMPLDINGELIEFKDFVHDKTGEISDNITNQASIAEENSASIQNIAGAIRNIADKLAMSVTTVKEDNKNVDKLCNNIQSIVTQMDKLIESIKNITSFANTIDSISSQTNLLSINARIESAKAGEFGRGFAVVADEINKLAMQSKEASNYVADSISDITNNSELMYQVINECFESSKGLLESAKNRDVNINNINDEIQTIENNITDASAGNQEITGTLQINAGEVTDIHEDESIAPNKPVFNAESKVNSIIADKDFGYGGYKIEKGEGIAVVTCDGLIRGHIAGEFFKDYTNLKSQIRNVSKSTLILDLRTFGVFANNKEAREAVKEVYRGYTEFEKVIAVIGKNSLIKMQLVNVLKSIDLLNRYTFVDRYTIDR